MTLNEYLQHYWKRTENARKKLGFDDTAFWKLLWTKNYFEERCEKLESLLTRVQVHEGHCTNGLMKEIKEELDDKD